jgi:hypothetical protein
VRSSITLEKTENADTITLATVETQAFVELDVSKMDLANGFNHVAVKVMTDTAIVVGVVLQRGNARYTPVQKVGSSAVY